MNKKINNRDDGRSLKSFPEKEKPRERLLCAGREALSEAELLAIVLDTGTKNANVLDVSRKVLSLSADGSLSGLYEVSPEQLRSVRGIGRVKAAKVLALCELARRIGLDKTVRKLPSIRSVEELGDMLAARKRWLKKEVFSVVMVDRKWNIIRIADVSVGTLEQAAVHPREVFLEAVKCSAGAIVLSHNHPSGDPTPSREDLATTERLVKAGRIMGIEVADHIITGGDSYYSMFAHGEMAAIAGRP